MLINSAHINTALRDNQLVPMTEHATKMLRLGDLGELPVKASARDEISSDTSGKLPSTAMIRDRFSPRSISCADH